jgi:hypothetical protein
MISDGDGPIPDGGMSPFHWGCGYEPVFYLDESARWRGIFIDWK